MDRTPTAMTPKAPGASTPGYGAGNVPFAPGIISGRNLGQQTNPAPLAREAGGGVTLNIQGSPPPPSPPGIQETPQPQAPVISPETYMRVLDAYMGALLESVKTGKPLVGGIY